MTLGISQLAFDSIEDLKKNLRTLKKFDIENLEVVYSKMESNPVEYTRTLIENKIKTKSTQSILFGSDVQDFLDNEFVNQIRKVSESNTFFGVKTLVLGSPKQRKEFREDELLEKFIQIDTILEEANQILCIEPNCKTYGGGYFFTVEEIVKFIQKGEFRNIRTMIDTHNIINENQSPSEVYLKYKDFIHHIHVSEDKLSDFNESDEHIKLAEVLRENNFQGLITYEVLPSKNVKESLEKFNSIYK
jgi:sugar phosphate isomerase/epimerase